jgi:NAD(P)-dependent dehydrogenase (short-subunit alcohol dehydrogenase family)
LPLTAGQGACAQEIPAETTYRGSNKLKGKKTVITGADSGIGRAVALAFAREGADVLVAYLDEHDDANETKRLIEEAGRKCVLVAGDVSASHQCHEIVRRAVDEFGRIDVLVNNAAHQMSFNAIEEISDEEWEKTLSTNISAMFYIVNSAVAHMPEGSSIINTTSVNADAPSPHLLAYATTKGAIENFTGGLAQLLAEKGIRANAVAPGPVWTPLIPSTMPVEAVTHFGEQVPMKRPAQPCELASVYVMLASDEASYVSGRDHCRDRRQTDHLNKMLAESAPRVGCFTCQLCRGCWTVMAFGLVARTGAATGHPTRVPH